MSVMHGAEEILLPARVELGWLPDLDAVDESVWRRLRMLILNYPNNPTGAQAPASFFEHAVELAKRYGFLIVHDFAYTGLGVSDQQVSLLTVPGASDVSVEVDPLSKMYAMAGWRAGFVAGNRDVVARLKQYHYQMGSMVTGMIQDAGAVALNSDQSCVDELARRYAGRREIVAGGLRSLGFDVFDSAGGIYVWFKAPEGWSGQRFADALLDVAQVAGLPGTCWARRQGLGAAQPAEGRIAAARGSAAHRRSRAVTFLLSANRSESFSIRTREENEQNHSTAHCPEPLYSGQYTVFMFVLPSVRLALLLLRTIRCNELRHRRGQRPP